MTSYFSETRIGTRVHRWAIDDVPLQVNGLRDDTDLAARAQPDLSSIDNGSVWLDIQILLLTFARWRHPNGY